MEDAVVLLIVLSPVMLGKALVPKTRIAVETQKSSGIPLHSSVCGYPCGWSLLGYVVIAIWLNKPLFVLSFVFGERVESIIFVCLSLSISRVVVLTPC